MLRFFTGSLRRKIILTVTIAAIVPGCLLAFVSYHRQRHLLERTYGEQLQEGLDSQAALITTRIYSLMTLARRSAAEPDFRDWLRDGRQKLSPGVRLSLPVEMGSVLDGDFAFGLLDPDGRLDFLSESGWKVCLEECLSEHQWSDEDIGMERPRFLAPVHKGSPPDGLVVWRMAVDEVWPEGATAANRPRNAQGWHALLAVRPSSLMRSVRRERFAEIGLQSTSGGLVAHLAESGTSNLPRVRLHRPMPLDAGMRDWSFITPDEVPEIPNTLIYTYTKLHVLNPAGRQPGQPEWFLVALADTDAIEAPLSLLYWTNVVLGVLLMGLMTLLGALLSGRIAVPLRHLRDEVRLLAGGNLDARADVSTNDELAELARDINSMAARLRDTYTSLERSAGQAESRANQLAVINQLTSAMTSAMTLRETFESLGHFLPRLGPIGYASLALPKQDDDAFDIWVSKNSIQTPNPFPFRILQQAFEQERAMVVNTDVMEERTSGRLQRGLVLPLVAGRELIGTLNLASARHDAFTPERIGNLTFVAEALAAAIQHNRLYERVSRFAAELEAKVRQRTAELEKAQTRLLQNEKFAATAKIAANLSHEINNPLGIIKNHLFLLEQQLNRAVAQAGPATATPLADARRTIQICREEIERIARLTRSMLNFYRTPTGEAREIDMMRVMEDIALLLRKGLEARRITFEMHADHPLPTTVLSPDMVRQVFMNILRNAEDATEPGGHISVKMRVEPPGSAYGGRLLNHPEGTLLVAITDTGKGIAPEHLDKIFDPFFTTKLEEKGTGLGLSVTLGIMERLQGAIAVQSEPGKGTTVELRFPITREAPKSASSTDPGPAASTGSTPPGGITRPSSGASAGSTATPPNPTGRPDAGSTVVPPPVITRRNSAEHQIAPPASTETDPNMQTYL